MHIDALDPQDPATVEALVDLFDRTWRADRPDMPEMPTRLTVARFQNPKPGHAYLFHGIWEGERLIAVLEMVRPTMENWSLAYMEIEVAPDRRRRGCGRALWERAQAIAADHGRTTIATSARDRVPGGSDRSQAGKTFLETLGFTVSLREDIHLARVTHLSDGDIEANMDSIRPHLDGYEILSWVGDIPPQFRSGILRLDRMVASNIPTGDMDLEEQQFDEQRSIDRAKFREACGMDSIYTVARHNESQLFVGETVFLVYPEPAEHAFQGITLVDGDHRGHGLGMALKLENLKLLRNEFPRISVTETATASVNATMNAINAKFGYEPRESKLNYQIKL